MCGDPDRGRDDNEVFDDVLTFKGRDEQAGPHPLFEQEEWHKSRDHVEEKQRDHHSLGAFDQKQDTDQAFEQAKQYQKSFKADDWRHGTLKKFSDHAACRTLTHHLERPKPKEDHEKREARHRHTHPPKKIYESHINIPKRHGFIIAKIYSPIFQTPFSKKASMVWRTALLIRLE